MTGPQYLGLIAALLFIGAGTNGDTDAGFAAFLAALALGIAAFAWGFENA